MKTNIKLLLITLLVFNTCNYGLLKAQFTRGNGNVTESKRTVSNVKSVEIEDGIDLYISQGKKENLKIEADENLHELIKTDMDGDNLRIYLSERVRKAGRMNVYLTIKDIKGLRASGGSDVYTQTALNVNTLSVICSGGSDAKMEVSASELKFKATGGSDGYLKGNATIFKGKATGGSDIHASKLVAGNCQVEVTGGSDAKIYVNGELVVRASGGSDVSYKGQPSRVDSNMSGGSGLHHDTF